MALSESDTGFVPKSLSRVALDSANVGIWIVDENWRTIRVNPRMCNMLGYSTQELLGRSPEEFIDPTSAAQWDVLVSRREAGIEEYHDFLFRRKDGGELWVIISGAPMLDKDGRFIGGVAVMTEITERRLLEARSFESHKLEVARTMTSAIAHQFNNKLQPLLSYVDMCLRDPGLRESTRGYLNSIREIAESSKDAVGQMLAAVGISRKHRSSADLATILRTCLRESEDQRPGYVQLELEIEQEPCQVEVDPNQINVAVSHLIRNGIQAIDPTSGGTVRIAMRPGEDGFVSVSVEDDGSGMEPELLSKAFDPFFSTQPPDRSWGQGLYYVSEAIRGHGGSIKMTSNPGSGSLVTFRLPMQVEAVGVTSSIAPSGSLKRLLLVDDSRDTVKIWKEVFELEGFAVQTFPSGIEAQGFMANHMDDFDLLITDLSMPGISGVDLIHSMRMKDPGKPAILISGHCSSDADMDIQQMEGVLLLRKPVRLEALRKAVLGACVR